MADRVPVWIDCDPGHDDAFALLIAATHPRLRLLGVSTVHGNAGLAAVTHNAASLLSLLGCTAPIVPGAPHAINGTAAGAQRFHGESGLAGVTLLPAAPGPSAAPSSASSAAAAMAVAFGAEAPGTAWLVAIGPLTNVAAFVQEHGQTARSLAGLSIMGGAGGTGAAKWLGKAGDAVEVAFPNRWAEFNVWSDAEAARIVFAAEQWEGKVTVAALDLTYGVLATADVFQRLFGGERAGTKVRHVYRQILEHSRSAYTGYFVHLPGPPLHDPLAVAVLLEGGDLLFDDGGRRWNVEVVTQGEQAGRTVLTETKGPGVRWLKAVTEHAFWTLIADALGRAEGAAVRIKSP